MRIRALLGAHRKLLQGHRLVHHPGREVQAAVARLTLLVAGGKSVTPKLKLITAARKLLAAKRKLALKGTVVITDAAGNTRTFTVRATLKAAAKKKRR